MRKMPLYYGDNGVHEFWESTNEDVLIFRNHNEKWWQVFVQNKWLEPSMWIEKAIKTASRKYGCKLIKDPSHRWIKTYKENRMVLLAI